jgi:hypothetical protein
VWLVPFHFLFLLHDDASKSTLENEQKPEAVAAQQASSRERTETPGVFSLFIATKARFIAVFLLFRFSEVLDNESSSGHPPCSAPKHHCVTNRQTPVSLTQLNILSRAGIYLFIAEAVTVFNSLIYLTFFNFFT